MKAQQLREMVDKLTQRVQDRVNLMARANPTLDRDLCWRLCLAFELEQQAVVGAAAMQALIAEDVIRNIKL